MQSPTSLVKQGSHQSLRVSGDNDQTKGRKKMLADVNVRFLIHLINFRRRFILQSVLNTTVIIRRHFKCEMKAQQNRQRKILSNRTDYFTHISWQQPTNSFLLFLPRPRSSLRVINICRPVFLSLSAWINTGSSLSHFLHLAFLHLNLYQHHK